MGRQVAGAEQVLLPALADLSGHVIWRAHARVTAAIEDVLPDNVDIHGYAALVALGDGTPRSQQALARMLEGTGIPFRITSDRTALVGQQASI